MPGRAGSSVRPRWMTRMSVVGEQAAGRPRDIGNAQVPSPAERCCTRARLDAMFASRKAHDLADLVATAVDGQRGTFDGIVAGIGHDEGGRRAAFRQLLAGDVD